MQQRNAQDLAASYSRGHRRLEVASIGVFALLAGATVLRVLMVPRPAPVWAIAAAVLGAMVMADWISGLVHWMADTWGTVDWPIVGPSLIRPFREHHVDALAITRHDFVETNGDSCFVASPVLVAIQFLDYTRAGSYCLALFGLSFCFLIMATNQIHKWAHMRVAPGYVRVLQRVGLILDSRDHAIHHTPPFTEYYCITTGWLNPLLGRTGLFRTLERVVTRLTGAIPREDDIGLEAARELARVQGLLASRDGDLGGKLVDSLPLDGAESDHAAAKR